MNIVGVLRRLRGGVLAALAAGTVALSVVPLPAQSSSIALQVTITGVRSSAGTVIASICRAGESFPSRCSVTVRAAAVQGVTLLKVPHIERGRYALALFHDEDGDGQLNLIREGIGFSNDANHKWAPPDFDASGFTIDGMTKLSVRMRYHR